MEFSDVIELVGIYLGGFAGIFSLAFAPWALWQWFKSMTATDYKGES